MIVFFSGTEPVDKINMPIDGTLWLLLLGNH